TDARIGRIRDAMTPYLAREDYGAGLARGVDLIAGAFAQEFAVTLTGVPGLPPGEGGQALPIPLGWIVVAVALLIVLSLGRILLLPPWFAGWGRGVGGWSGGRGGGWGGGGGGSGVGFGAVGGRGGLSGGGAA